MELNRTKVGSDALTAKWIKLTHMGKDGGSGLV